MLCFALPIVKSRVLLALVSFGKSAVNSSRFAEKLQRFAH